MQYESSRKVENAMRAHDKNRLSILRQVHGEVKNIEVNERREIVEADNRCHAQRVLKQTGETLGRIIKAATSEESARPC
ncbi:MAG: GatB/YqeY domain-containing protein [Slackia sp.]